MSGCRLSVVIPTHERRELAVRALDALAGQAFDEPWEVVVVVDGGVDGTAAALAGLDVPFRLTVLEQARAGAAGARNRGAAAARGEVVLFLDDDMEAQPGLLAEHDRSHRAGADAVVGHIPLHPDSPPTLISGWVGGWAERRRTELGSADVRDVSEIVTGQLSVRRDVFDRLGGFDDGFTENGSFGNEDVDFGWRLLRAGHRVVFNPDAVSLQRYIVTARRNIEQHRDWGAADVRLVRLHPELHDRIFGSERKVKRFDRYLGRAPALGLGPFRGLVCRRVDRGASDRWTEAAFMFGQRAAYWAGVRGAGGPPGRYAIRVLCWHAVQDLSGDPVLRTYGVTPATFGAQLDELRSAGWRFVTPNEFVGYLQGRNGLPERSVLVTFDDCYDDLLTGALPELRRRGISAVAFAIAGAVGGTNEWDRPLGARPVPLLDADGLRALAAGPFEIGAHGSSHRQLPLVGDDELVPETAGAADALEAMGLPRPRLFAYPYGEHDGRTRRAVEDAGFVAALTVDPGVVRPDDDRYRLPRLEIGPDDVGSRLRWTVRSATVRPRLDRARSRVHRVRAPIRRLLPASRRVTE